jgi:hypothetical protein
MRCGPVYITHIYPHFIRLSGGRSRHRMPKTKKNAPASLSMARCSPLPRLKTLSLPLVRHAPSRAAPTGALLRRYALAENATRHGDNVTARTRETKVNAVLMAVPSFQDLACCRVATERARWKYTWAVTAYGSGEIRVISARDQTVCAPNAVKSKRFQRREQDDDDHRHCGYFINYPVESL